MIPAEAVEAAAYIKCESHHRVSTNVPGLHVRWIIQCSICEAYNVEEMNAGHVRAVVTVADLESLTIGSIVLDVDGDPWKKRPDGLWLGLRNELEESATLFWGHTEIRPTVLYGPTP